MKWEAAMNQAIRVALADRKHGSNFAGAAGDSSEKSMEAGRAYIFEKMIMAMMIIHMSGQPEA